MFEKIVATLKSAASSTLFASPVATLSESEQVTAYETLKGFEAEIKERKEELRIVLLALAESKGTKNEKTGTFKAEIDGNEVSNERRTVGIDEAKLMALLAAKGLKADTAFTEVKTTTVQIDASKIEALVKLGKLTEKDIEGVTNFSRALKVKAGTALKSLIEAATAPESNLPKAKKAKKNIEG